MESQERECDRCHEDGICVRFDDDWVCVDCLGDATGYEFEADDDGSKRLRAMPTKRELNPQKEGG